MMTSFEIQRLPRGLHLVLPPILALTAIYLAGCKTTEPSVPMYGQGEELQLLVGEWRGQYESRETGRHGSLYFSLFSAADSAVGHVTMNANPLLDEPGDNLGLMTNAPVTLSIRFVSIGMGRIVGRLNDYRDPVCGCMLDTVFEGHIDGDKIEGVYFSHGEGFHIDTAGRWTATRMKKADKSSDPAMHRKPNF